MPIRLLLFYVSMCANEGEKNIKKIRERKKNKKAEKKFCQCNSNLRRNAIYGLQSDALLGHGTLPITVYIVSPIYLLHLCTGERGGSVVECRTPEREVRGSRPTAAVLCP